MRLIVTQLVKQLHVDRLHTRTLVDSKQDHRTSMLQTLRIKSLIKTSRMLFSMVLV